MKSPNLPPNFVESIVALDNGFFNLIATAKLRNDEYDVGYITAMRESFHELIVGVVPNRKHWSEIVGETNE